MRTLWTLIAGLAGLFGAAGVALAAAGAHLSGTPIVTTAAYFLLFHASALAAFCAVARGGTERGLGLAALLIALGCILFSGDLAMRGLADRVILHLAAPTGGVVMILGWLVAALALPAALRHAVDAQMSH